MINQDITIEQIYDRELALYSEIPIIFVVSSFFEISFKSNGLEGIELELKKVKKSYLKNYDKYLKPLEWPLKWDTSDWGFFLAKVNGQIAGGATVITDAKDIILLEERSDLALLWDMRVHPDFRGNGIGKKLFAAVQEFSINRGKSLLKIETQNINVDACRFYASQGCKLEAIHPGAYNEFPEEAQLFWYKKLQQ